MISAAGLRRRAQALVLALACGFCLNVTAAPWVLASADASWTLQRGVIEGLGITLTGDDRFLTRGRSGGTLTLDLHGDGFQKFDTGGLVFTGGPELHARGRLVDLGTYILRAAPDSPTDLAVFDLAGGDWLRLRLGHHWVPSGTKTLRSEVMDIRPGPELIKLLGDPAVSYAALGTVTLAGQLLTDAASQTIPKLCSGTPNWPDGQGNVVDLLMIPDSRRAIAEFERELGRSRGVVYVAPNARFRMIGSADTPWYSRFVTPELDSDCIDDGTGACQPYGESAGGYLVWNVYRIRPDGIAEQVGASGVKHAFNSVNFRSSDPNVDCACAASARVAYAGCEDFYSAGTNADERFLGPRDEIEAFPVSWNSCGSVFDRNCDDVCDIPANSLWQCVPDVEDHTDFLPAIREDVLESGDRLFVESWYLVREDIDLFNSMSTIEVTPSGGGAGTWLFDDPRFAVGPTISNLADEAGREAVEVDSGSGRLLVDARAEDLGDGWHRYLYSIMNVDYDAQVSRFAVSLGDDVNLRNPMFVGVAGRSTTDWLLVQTPGEIAWNAPTDETLDWGTMMTFVFEADQPPIAGAISFDSPGAQGGLSSQAPRPASSGELILRSGFEASDANR